MRKFSYLRLALVALLVLALAGCSVASPTASPSGSPSASNDPTLSPSPTVKPTHLPSQWTVLGAGGGGTTYNPAVSPHDSNIVMLNCDMTNNYITYDGTYYRQINIGGSAKQFYYDPIDPNIIYAAGPGLHRTVDQGNTWVNLITGGSMQVAVDPANNRCIYYVDYSATLHYSTDFGETFTAMAPIFTTSMTFVRICVDPTSPQDDRRVYVFTDSGIYLADFASGNMKQLSDTPLKDASWYYDGNQITYYVITVLSENNAQFANDIMRSTDGMASWTCVSTSIDKGVENNGLRRVFNMVRATKDNTLYVTLNGTRTPEGSPAASSYGIAKSTDGGDTWTVPFYVPGGDYPENYSEGWLERVYRAWWGGPPIGLGICESNADICYVTDMGIAYRTLDGGETWGQIYCTYNEETGMATSTGLDVTNVYDYVQNPFNKDMWFMACTDVGGFYSLDGGKSWASVVNNGVPSAWRNTCYGMVYDPEEEGKAWSVWSGCHDLPFSKMFANGNDLSNSHGGVCVSNDGGITWTPIVNAGLPANAVVTDIVIDPRSPVGNRTLFVTVMNQGVYRSKDGGASWEAVNNGIEETKLRAWKIMYSPDNRVVYLVITHQGSDDTNLVPGAFYRSTNGGEKWTKLTMPDGVHAFNSISFDPEKNTRIYATGWAHKGPYGTIGGGAYVSEDSGKSWRKITGSIENDETITAYGIHVDSRDANTIYMSTWDGNVWVTRDAGTTWKAAEGFEFQNPKMVFEDPDDPTKIYVATFGGAVWHGPLPE